MEASDTAIIEEVLRGNADAFRGLVDRHGRSIFRLGYRMTGNENDADEVVQETFLRAYRQLSGFETRASFSTWLHRIAINCAIDLVKARNRRFESATDLEGESIVDKLAGAEPDPDRRLRSGEMRAAVERALRRLSDSERTAFVMRHFEGMSIQEIGSVLGTKVSATKNTIFRAVQKLRGELEPLVRTDV